MEHIYGNLKFDSPDREVEQELLEICDHFKIDGKYLGYAEIKLGHINSTYYVHYIRPKEGDRVYVLQKINMYVFKNPRVIMENIDKICSHIREVDPSAALHFHHTRDGKNYFINRSSFWRLYTYVVGTTVDGNSADGMYAAGKAFGKFQMDLNDFDASCLKETIPNFHNTKKRFEHLFATSIEEPCERMSEVINEMMMVHEIASTACKICTEQEKKAFPLRPTHNDTKTNNVLTNEETSEPICVIDLDTVMPGLIMHDFGDAIRYGANAAAEDEADLSLVKLDLDMFRAFAEGFIGQTASILTKNELEYMALGAVTMASECGVRFLDDYLSGDQYFRIAYPEHNLVRARNQLTLAKDMIEHLDEMNAIVKEIYEKSVNA